MKASHFGIGQMGPAAQRASTNQENYQDCSSVLKTAEER